MWIGSPTPAAGQVATRWNTLGCAARGSLLACVFWLLALDASVRVAVVDGAERPRLVAVADPPAASPRDSGYRGVWYANQPSGDEYRYKYSGGFATYPHQTVPCALYDATVNRTFFGYPLEAVDRMGGGAAVDEGGPGLAMGRRENPDMPGIVKHEGGVVVGVGCLLVEQDDRARDTARG
ncbi:MAG: hypothetical protein ACKOJF_00580, partial [Planctomycetaceae bacterium]